MLRGRPNRDTCVMSYLERQTTMTGNQRRIILAAMLGDMLEFFDYYLIGFVLAFIVGPWKLTFGQSAIILLSSGFGSMFGAVFYGRLADKIGCRTVFMATVLSMAIGTWMLEFTSAAGWLYITL